MERLYTKRVDFKVTDEEATTDVTELEEVFKYKSEIGPSYQPVSFLLEECPLEMNQVLKRYGRRLCPRSENCEADTETRGQSLCATGVPSDESFSEIIDMILKVYGNQPCKENKQHKTKSASKRSSTTDLSVASDDSKETQTTLASQRIEMFTNTRDCDTSFSLLKGVCFRPFLGPSLDETGVYFGENLPMIRHFLGTIKDKIFKEDGVDSLDDSRIDLMRASLPSRRRFSESTQDILWEERADEVGSLMDDSRVDR